MDNGNNEFDVKQLRDKRNAHKSTRVEWAAGHWYSRSQLSYTQQSGR